MTAPTAQQAPKKSIWKNKWTWIIIGGVLVVGLIGGILNPPPQVTVADVTGKPADVAQTELEALGFRVTLDSDGAGFVGTGSDWDVESTDPAAGTDANEGSAVTVYVVEATERLAAEQAEAERIKAEEDARAEEERAAREAERLASPIDVYDAQFLCERRAELEFPYGVKVHTIMGVLAEEQTENGWFLKYEATVTNAFNAERKMNIECHISGTTGSPSMDDFLYY